MARIVKVFLLTPVVCFSLLGMAYAAAVPLGVPVSVPEPGSFLLIVTGLLGIGFLTKRFKR